jgi:Tol biopolymer transport system component
VGKLQTSGDAVPVAEHVGSTAIDIRAYFSSSGSGVLAYDSPSTVSQFGYSQLTWIDRSGKVSGIVGPPGSLAGAAVSGDGNSVTVSRLDPQSGLFDVWLYNLERRTNSRFTFNSQNNLWPFWSSDGSHIVFYSSPGGSSTVYQKATSGAGKDEILDKSTGVRSAVDRSNDGRYLIEQAIGDSQTGYDIWVLPLFGGKKPLPYLQTNANESSPRLSPNGQWLAYQSDETKRNEIYLTTFPQPGGRWQVSANGGSTPVWSRDGKELFYIGADGKMNAVEVKVGPKFDAGVPRTLFDVHMTGGLNGTFYDVGKDGRFLIPVPAVPAGQGGTEPITVVVNWTVGLKK